VPGDALLLRVARIERRDFGTKRAEDSVLLANGFRQKLSHFEDVEVWSKTLNSSTRPISSLWPDARTAHASHGAELPATIGLGGHGLQLVQLAQYAFPIILVLFRLDPGREVGIKVENVGAQLRRGLIELPVRQLTQQLCIAVVREGVFRCLRRIASVKITVRQHQCVGAHFFEKDPLLIDGRIDALDVQVLGLRGRCIER